MCGARAYLIDGPENITDDMVAGARVVGVTAGASAPEDIVQAVIDDLRRRGATEVENLVLQEEDVSFRLPPDLVQIWQAHRQGRRVPAPVT
jgi:4-hydroxy-3-methylbut-2-enyl diphosphate reductase